MANFPHALNTDSNMKLTNGIWDDNIAEWMIKVQNYVMSSGGIIWIPDILDTDGNKKVSVKNSALPTGAATNAALIDLASRIVLPIEVEGVPSYETIPYLMRSQQNMITLLYNLLNTTKPHATAANQDTMIAALEELGNSVVKIDPAQNNVQVSGSMLDEQKTETDAVGGILTFANDIVTIEIFNTDDTNAGVFTVNGINLHVPASQVFKAKIGGTVGKTVTITGATTYIISTYV